MNVEQLKKIVPTAPYSRLDKFIGPLNEAMILYDINTPLRQAAFIAQLAHESGSFLYVRELASGKAYEGRKDLGNTNPGDGVKYKGRGLIQITGRGNYSKCSEALGLDLVNNPELLEEPAHACTSAAWFWDSRKLNDLADTGDFRQITKRINGGYNGLEDREQFYAKAKKVLGA